MYWPLIEWSEWHNEMQFWIFCTWQGSGRPCRRLFDPAIATQLKQAAHFMGQWNTRPTSAFIILSCTDMQIICFMVTPRMNDLRASDVKMWGLCPLSQMWRKLKSKLQIPTPDIWWCPWDKGGAVIYVIGGTHPPIWLAIDINHHQISNGHAFPSAIKCAHSVWHKSKTSFSVCLFLSVCACVSVCVSERSGWFGEADERQFVAEEGEGGGSCLSSMETSNGRRVVESQDLVTRHGNDARKNQWREKTAMILIWHWLCFGNNGALGTFE